jgi:hypothetical protein
MPDLSPGHAADWHLRQLRLGEETTVREGPDQRSMAARMFVTALGPRKYEASMSREEGHPAPEAFRLPTALTLLTRGVCDVSAHARSLTLAWHHRGK